MAPDNPSKLAGILDALCSATPDVVRGEAEHPRFLVARVPTDHPYADGARYVERVFSRDFYLDLTDDAALDRLIEHELAEELAPYESASTFLLLVDRERRAFAGSLRYVQWSPTTPLKTLVDAANIWGVDPDEVLTHHGIEPYRAFDISMAGVTRSYRLRPTASDILYWMVYADALADGEVTHLITVFVSPFLRLLQRKGIPFQALLGCEEERVHMGQPSIPATMCVQDAERLVTVQRDREYQRVSRGRGLDYALVDFTRREIDVRTPAAERVTGTIGA